MMIDELKTLISKLAPQFKDAVITGETRLTEDLGLDSLSMMMFSMELEDKFGVRFDKPVVFKTVQDVCDYLEANGVNK